MVFPWETSILLLGALILFFASTTFGWKGSIQENQDKSNPQESRLDDSTRSAIVDLMWQQKWGNISKLKNTIILKTSMFNHRDFIKIN